MTNKTFLNKDETIHSIRGESSARGITIIRSPDERDVYHHRRPKRRD